MNNESKHEERKINLEKVLWIPGSGQGDNKAISNGFVILEEDSGINTFCFPFSNAMYESIREGTPGDHRGRAYGQLTFIVPRLRGQKEFTKAVREHLCYNMNPEDLAILDDRYPDSALQGLQEMVDHTNWTLRYDLSTYDGRSDAVKFVYVPELYEQNVKIAEVATNHVSPSFKVDL
jgi:hypothetical protein